MNELLSIARRLSRNITDEAAARGLAVVTSVVDVHGNLVLKERMDGSLLIAIEMSERKAYTSAAFGAPTKDLTESVLPGGPLHTLTSVAGGRFVAFGGGMPIRLDGRLVAGVGVSGGTTEEDVELVEAAMSGVVPTA
jgi:uncharacterized protein GlcG (DUF336 family)